MEYNVHNDRMIGEAMVYVAAQAMGGFPAFDPVGGQAYNSFQWYKRELSKSMVSSIKSAEKREAAKAAAGKPFAAVILSLDEGMAIHKKQGYRCDVTGMPFWRGNDGDSYGPRMPSLDRVVHNGPYAVCNVRVVLHTVNSMRGRGSDTGMREVALRMLEHAEYLDGGVIRLPDRSAGGRSRC